MSGIWISRKTRSGRAELMIWAAASPLGASAMMSMSGCSASSDATLRERRLIVDHENADQTAGHGSVTMAWTPPAPSSSTRSSAVERREGAGARGSC